MSFCLFSGAVFEARQRFGCCSAAAHRLLLFQTFELVNVNHILYRIQGTNRACASFWIASEHQLHVCCGQAGCVWQVRGPVGAVSWGNPVYDATHGFWHPGHPGLGNFYQKRGVLNVWDRIMTWIWHMEIHRDVGNRRWFHELMCRIYSISWKCKITVIRWGLWFQFCTGGFCKKELLHVILCLAQARNSFNKEHWRMFT